MNASRAWTTAATLGLLAGFLQAGVYGQEPSPASPPKLKEVVVVFKTHFDIGYTDLARNILDKYRTTMIEKALAVGDETRSLPPQHQFIWTLPGWPLDQIVGPLQTPQRRERVLADMREGRFVWHALPFTTHTESLELEDVVRGMRFSSDLSRGLGLPLPRDAKMTDVPSHAWVLPTILKRAGVDFLHIGVNRCCYTPEVPPLFWWEGPDGSRVLTMIVSGYGTGLVPPKGWPYPTWLALMHTSDNEGPPEPQAIRKLLDQAAKELPGVPLRMGRLCDFADAVLRDKPELPVVRADMPDTWIHGLMSMPVETKLAREIRPRIAALDALNTLLGAWGLKADDLRDTIRTAYERSLLYGEHTWGMDAKKFPRLYGPAWEAEYAKGRFAKLEESWAEHGDHVRAVEKLVRPALDARMAALAGAVAADGRRIVVFNPLSWARDDVVIVPSWDKPPVALRDVATGQLVPVDAADGNLRFVAKNVPSLGYRTFVPALDAAGKDYAPLAVDEAAATLENEFFRVRLDVSRGTIASLIEKSTGRELVAEGFGQYLYERFSAADAERYIKEYTIVTAPWVPGDFGKPGLPTAKDAPRTAATPTGFTLATKAGICSATATLSAPSGERIPHGVALSVTLYRNLPVVDLEWSIRDKKPDPWPEAGWLCLPVAATEPQFRLGRLGSITDPCAEIQPGTNHDVFCLNTGATVTGRDGTGLGICPIDSPLVSLDSPGLWRFRKEGAPKKPLVYVNLYNNQWATNFQQWIGGTWSSRVRLWPVGANANAAASLIGPSWEARSRCLAAVFDGPAGALAPSQAGVTIERGGVLVTALGPNPDGEGTMLRLWEQAGVGGKCAVALPKGLSGRKVQPYDLRGRPWRKPIGAKEGRLGINLPAFAPMTVIVY